jgi:pimeloyl-ACP methyl ester carboxylesterase
MPVIVLGIGVSIVWLSFRRVLSLPAKVRRLGRRRVEQVVLSLIIVLAAAVTASSAFNAITIWSFRPRDPTPGNIYVVDGHKMHIDCMGSASPTLVLESGLGSAWEIWSKVQPELSRTTRVCSYDRAGYGYSDAQLTPRDADHIAIELHGLLLQAQVTGPIVLMGHSLGGLFIRDYATRYPEQVAGLVFLDAVTPPWALGKVDAPPQWITRVGVRVACSTNSPALVGSCSWPRPGLAPRWKIAAEGLCHPQSCAMEPESDSFDRSGEETLPTGQYGTLPVLIISHDPAKAAQPADWENAWSQMQEDLKKLSTRSRRIVARNSGHMIQLDRANLIEKEVSLFIEQIRGRAPQPSNYGSTTIE